MKVVITEWALNSYLDLKHSQVFTEHEYRNILRPDAELLKKGWPSKNPKFSTLSSGDQRLDWMVGRFSAVLR